MAGSTNILICVLSTVSVGAVIFEGSSHTKLLDEDVGTCLRTGDPVLPCLTSGAVRSLDSARSVESFGLDDDLSLIKDYIDDDGIEELKGDPREGQTLIDTISTFLEKRYLNWDLSYLYPGLVMRVGPSARGALYFTLDKRVHYDDRSMGTGRLLIKRTVLPILLGLKLNVVSLVPILFAALIIITKKALLFSKLSLLASVFSFFRNKNSQQNGNVEVDGWGNNNFQPLNSHRYHRKYYWQGREAVPE